MGPEVKGQWLTKHGKRCFGPTFRIEAGSESLRFDLDCQA